MINIIKRSLIFGALSLVSQVSVSGVITYTLNNRVYYINSAPNSTPFDVTAALNKTAVATGDNSLNISPNGRWLVMNAQRRNSNCVGWECLLVMNKALTSVQVVRHANGQVIHPEGFSAISSSGAMIIFPAVGVSHHLDLWRITKDATGNWSAPVAITASSPYAWNSQPAISMDGSKIVFDCGNQPYAGAGTAICEVNTSGGKFRVVLTPANKPTGYPTGTALHHPDYTEGGIVFEGDWGGERVWMLDAGTKNAELINSTLHNDNSPCVLPTGESISLWLNRPNTSGSNHELKLMSSIGGYRMVAINKDISDIGIGCGAD